MFDIKKYVILLLIAMLLISFVSCSKRDTDTATDTSTNTITDTEVVLKSPKGLQINEKSLILSWVAVKKADSYEIMHNGEIIKTNATSIKVKPKAAENRIKVRSVLGDERSEWSDEVVFVSPGTVTVDDINYSLENGEMTVIGYIGNSDSVIIPAEIDGYKVTAIGESAFDGLTEGIGITAFRLMIPYSISHIRENAFKNCDGLVIELDTHGGISIDEWSKKVVIEKGNNDVLDVIIGKRPCIGFSEYI